MNRSIIIKNETYRREVFELIQKIQADGSYSVTFAETSKRNLEQNNRMWAMLSEVAAQVVWYGSRLTPEEWKIVFTAALKKTRIVPDLDGTGFVSLGASTSRMTVKEFSELIELINAFAAEHGVKFKADPNTKEG